MFFPFPYNINFISVWFFSPSPVFVSLFFLSGSLYHFFKILFYFPFIIDSLFSLQFPSWSAYFSSHFLLIPFFSSTPHPLLSVSLQTSFPSIQSWYWLSPHSFIKILPSTLLDAAPGRWASGALEGSARVSCQLIPYFTFSRLASLICSFQAA